MKEVIRYEASDGSLHLSEDLCIQHEAAVKIADEMARFFEIPESIRLGLGRWVYIRYVKPTVVGTEKV